MISCIVPNTVLDFSSSVQIRWNNKLLLRAGVDIFAITKVTKVAKVSIHTYYLALQLVLS